MSDRPPPASERPAATSGRAADENRTLTNIALVAVFLLVVGCGIWLVGALLDARRADECMGRRCSATPVTPQQLR